MSNKEIPIWDIAIGSKDERIVVFPASEIAVDETMADKLTEVLDILGYSKVKQPHYRSNLVHSIAAFAGLQGNSELEAQCEREIEKIRAEVQASSGNHENIRGPEYYK